MNEQPLEVPGMSLAARRSRAYALLAMAFRFPSADFCAAVEGGTFQTQLRDALAAIPGSGGSDLLPPEVAPSVLAHAYTALFDVGSPAGPPCPLYEGEHGGGHMGVMEDLLRFYRFFGLRLAPAERERPDHLAAELEFLHYLAFRQATAETAGSPEAAGCAAAAHDFQAEHTLHLVRGVAARIATGLPFYPALARLAAAFVVADHAQLVAGAQAAPAADGGRVALALVRLREDEAATGSAREPYSLAALRARPLPWDRIVKGTHLGNCWYNWLCNFNLYVADGVVLREEQVGNYPPMNDPAVPDSNPKGCQKGVCWAQRLYDRTRLKYPLKRLGARGEGSWQRISWDQALTEISDQLIDVLTTEGPQSVIRGGGTGGDMYGGIAEFLAALGSQFHQNTAETGDDHEGVAVTAGKCTFADSADNWFHADVILVWGGNPAYTHMANYHYIAEARYRGARVIAISPDYNASAIHADTWVPINIGTDAALALGMAQVILREGLARTDFVREQTDLALLVRTDTGRFLRELDVKRGGRDDIFYMYDEAKRQVVEAPRKTLGLGAITPALAGEYEAKTLKGRVRVRPVMALLREKLDREYTPEQVARITGVPAALTERLARDMAKAGGVVNIHAASFGKFYHGDLIQRSIFLLFALCGHMGRKGASFNAYPMLQFDSALGDKPRGSQALRAAEANDPRVQSWKLDGYTDEMILAELARDRVKSGAGVLGHSALLHWVHSGLFDLSSEHQSWDPELKRPVREYVNEAFAKGWHVAVPPPGRPPQVMFQASGNLLRRGRATNQLMRNLVDNFKLIVTTDTRMSTTALYSDYVLPACSSYERTGLPIGHVPAHPFLQAHVQAIEPLYESVSDRAIFVMLARALARRAKERGLTTYRDRGGNERRFAQVLESITVRGLYAEEDDEAVARDLFAHAANVESIPWETFKDRGYAAFNAIGIGTESGAFNATDVVPGEPIVPLTWHTQKKEPYATLTRRLQFYIDHDWYFEFGEQLPTHKQNPKAGGDYPLQMTSGHTRWSLHSYQTDDALLLALQRWEPVLYLSHEDAAARGIADGDHVEAFNDVGRFESQVLVTPTVRPGQAIIYHGWENYQFPGWRHFKSVMASPLNPLELAGGYGHLRSAFRDFAPGQNDRGTRLEVRKVVAGGPRQSPRPGELPG